MSSVLGAEIRSQMSDLDRAELDVVARFADQGKYISKAELPCFPWVGAIEVQLIRAGGRTGEFVLGLRSSEDAVLRKHLHRGVVTAVTLCGEWDYLERSWIARPGDYVRENSGAIKRMIQKKHYNKALYC